MARWRSSNATVCKTVMQGCDSPPGLWASGEMVDTLSLSLSGFMPWEFESPLAHNSAPIAQLVEQLALNETVPGSSPGGGI